MGNLPAGLSDVVEPLREADDYARLQEKRQRGLYNVLTGGPMPFLLVAHLFPLTFRGGQASLVVAALAWMLFFIACYPQMFLPLVRRIRPDWQSPLLEASLLKKSLEKLFWFQLPFVLIGVLFIPVGLVVTLWASGIEVVRLMEVMRLVQVAWIVVSVSAMAWHSQRQGDVWLANAFILWIPVSIIFWLALPADQAPYRALVLILGFALVSPPLFVGFLRLLAPRRWLLK